MATFFLVADVLIRYTELHPFSCDGSPVQPLIITHIFRAEIVRAVLWETFIF
jgi:hypothetical protein